MSRRLVHHAPTFLSSSGRISRATRMNGQKSSVGLHPIGCLFTLASRFISTMQSPVGNNALLPFSRSVHCYYRSIWTGAPSNEHKMIKDLELFLSTAQDNSVPTKRLCSTYLEKLCESHNLADAAYLLRHLHEKNIDLDLDIYNMLLAAAGEEEHFNVLSEIFKYLLLSRLPPDLNSYTYLAKAFHRVDDSDLLKFMTHVAEITSHKDPTVVNRILFVTAKYGLTNKSIAIFEELKRVDFKMDTVTYNTVLVILGKAGRVEQMLSEFKSMKDLGYTPDAVTYNTLINCLRRLGRLELCKLLTKEMFDSGIELELRTFTALMDALGRAGHVGEALEIFGEMKKSINPSIYVYRALVSDLKKAGKFDAAQGLLEEMNSTTLKLVGPEDFRQRRKGRRTSK